MIRPSDGDDLEANQRAGAACTFVRYVDAPGKLSTYAVVTVDDQDRKFIMRSQDLVREEVRS